MDCVSLICAMTRISAGIAALEETSLLVSPASECPYPGREPVLFAKRCFLGAVTLLLFAGLVSLSVLAKDGLYYPQSSSAHRVSKVSKMSQHQIPELGNERQEFVQAFPHASGDAGKAVRLKEEQETSLPRDSALLAYSSLRSPPRQ